MFRLPLFLFAAAAALIFTSPTSLGFRIFMSKEGKLARLEIHCPMVKDIFLDRRHHWSAVSEQHVILEDGSQKILTFTWKSPDYSLSNSVGQFKGAVYSGLTLGNLSCVYAPIDMKNASTFPVTLNLDQSTSRPTDASIWKRKKGNPNQLICLQKKPHLCAAPIHVDKQLTNPFKELRKLKPESAQKNY